MSLSYTYLLLQSKYYLYNNLTSYMYSLLGYLVFLQRSKFSRKYGCLPVNEIFSFCSPVYFACLLSSLCVTFFPGIFLSTMSFTHFCVYPHRHYMWHEKASFDSRSNFHSERNDTTIFNIKKVSLFGRPIAPVLTWDLNLITHSLIM